MKKILYLLVLFSLLLTGCSSVVETPTPTGPALPPTSEPVATATPTPQSDSSPIPPAGDYGPSDFPLDVNPLTGLRVSDPSLLERRPLLVKVSNLPRSNRPQWGLSLADIVYEYYTEEGTTRFAALFYGNDAEMVGPIRSARFIDVHLVRGYDAVFAFGLAYEKVLDRLYNAEFADRLVIEGGDRPMFRYDPAGYNHLMTNTAELSAYMTQKGIENGRQNLDGMSFQIEPPEGGQAAAQFVVRYSNAIYNRWQYDAALGEYMRFSDTADDPYGGQSEQYAQSTDRLTGESLSYDNVVVIYVLHEHYADEVWDIQLLGSGTAYVFRDGQVYQVQWQRLSPDSVVSLTNPDGSPFPFKPGTTWFEVIGQNSTVEQTDDGLRFLHLMP
ncbi:MAG: DUF3048 domain-containing protein [Chloroflexi bacterium]|nr:DUF3048 domain-containing protein [Chloroflexota bacterium]